MNTKTYIICVLLCLGLLLAASYGGTRAGLAANTLNGTWAYTGSLDSSRSSHTVTQLEDGRVLVTGGYDGEATLSSVEIYDPATGVWSRASGMHEARRSHSATLLSNGKVLVVGGSGESSYPASAEIYDPVTDVWSYTDGSVRQRYAHQATLLPDGRVLVTGGWQPSGDGFTFRSEIDIYDPSSDSWAYTGHLFSRVGHTATLLPNGQVLLAAGYYNEPVDDAKLYDPTANSLVDTGTLQTKRTGHSATLLSNGQVLVAGGRDATTGESPGLTSAELYDPATGSWSYTGSMNVLRTGHSAARLQEGFVLVAGGYDFTSGAATIASTEFYDPTTGVWSSTDDLNESRAGRIVSLTDGKVLFPGGTAASDGSYSRLSTVEVYQPDAISPTFNCADVSDVTPVECEALVALYDSTNGDNWTDNSNWLVTPTLCDWFGVSCTAGHIVSLHLQSNHLEGSIPSELENLAQLEWLALYDNQLSGTIPPELGNLGNLRGLSLQVNQLTGGIPPALGSLGSLQYLALFDNPLGGSIPPELGNLADLKNLTLYDNQLTGGIPPELGNLANLQQLNLRSNQLSGSVPAELGSLSSLEELRLRSNQLDGSIPPELGDLSHLRQLLLWDNQLTGSIPPELGNLSNLEELTLSSNQLGGSIPAHLGDLSSLTYFNVSGNQLSGPVPPELSQITGLTHLFLHENQLSGALPQNLVNLELTWFYFNDTDLCEPSDATFQAWLAGIPNLQSTGTICGEVPYFSQRDPDWIDHPLRTNGECSPACDTIGKCGCCLTSAAMVFKYYGSDLTPASLSDCMDRKACPFYWRVGETCSQEMAEWVDRYSFSWSRLEQELLEQPVILGMHRGDNTHWVVVLTGNGDDPAGYTIHDPWPINGAAIKLSAWSSGGWEFDWLAIYTGQPISSSSARTYATGVEPVDVEAVQLRKPGSDARAQPLTIPEAYDLDANSSVTGTVMLYRMTDVTMTLQLTAESEVSSVEEMLIWTDSMTQTTWQPFSTYASIPASEEIYARFRDGSDNVSPTVEDTLYPVNSPPTAPFELFLPLILRHP